MRNIKTIIKYLFKNIYINHIRYAYDNLYKDIYKNNKCIIKSKKTEKTRNLEEWNKFWKKLDANVREDSFIIFSKYIEEYDKIIPYDFYALYIAPLFNPIRCDGFYSDKNNLDLFLPKDFVAKTILRRIDGVFKSQDYSVLNLIYDEKLSTILDAKYDLILKPSIETSGGNGIVKIKYFNNEYYIGDNIVYCRDLYDYGNNFIIQECIKQSEFMSQFNQTCVNTMRLITYKSIKTGEIVVLANLLRIGAYGNFADNIHIGGKCVKIENLGRVGNELFDDYGNLETYFNNIDFGKSEFFIPNYNDILKFAKIVASKYPHHYLLALDIALDENNNPKLVEVNANYFSLEMLYFARIPGFGDYTEEVLEFVKQHMHDEKTIFNIPIK